MSVLGNKFLGGTFTFLHTITHDYYSFVSSLRLLTFCLSRIIEIDSDFPFPGCDYRSWKHDHLKRHVSNTKNSVEHNFTYSF